MILFFHLTTLLLLLVLLGCIWTGTTTAAPLLSSSATSADDDVDQQQRRENVFEDSSSSSSASSVWPSPPQQTQHTSRSLGDFDEINEILRNIQIDLPSVTVSGSGGSGTVELTQIQCWNIQIQNMDLQSSSSQSQRGTTSISLSITNLDMICRARYYYDGWWFVDGSGNVDITSYGNDAVIDGIVTSSSSSSSNSGGFSQQIPNTIDVSRCNPTININDLNFSNGGIFGWILDLVEPLLRNGMEESAQQQICITLREMLSNIETNAMVEIYDTLMVYDPSQFQLPNPIEIETNFLQTSLDTTTINTNQLLDYQDTTTDIVRWIGTIFDETTDYLLQLEIDPNTGLQDLKGNILMRQYILDDDKTLTIDISEDTTTDFDPIIYDGHDIYTQTTARVNSIKVIGLDTMMYITDFDRISSHTITNYLGWKELGIIVDIQLDIKPSTLPDSVIQGSPNTHIQEIVTVTISVDEIHAHIGILNIIDQTFLEQMKLGSLLQVDNIIPCLWSSIIHLEPTIFSATAIDINTPTLDGFVSPGLDRLFHSVATTTFYMYEQILLEASPSIFQNFIRPMLNEKLTEKTNELYNGVDGGGACPSPTNDISNNNNLMDLRDLLLEPTDSLQQGGIGNEPYGNLFSSVVMPKMQSDIFQADYFNTRVIQPITYEQSGIEGRMEFPTTKLLDYYAVSNPSSSASISSSFLPYEELEFTIFNLRIDNMDIVAENSIQLLEPTDWNKLYNTIELYDNDDDNDNGRDLNVTVTVLLWIRGDSPLAMSNQIDFSLSIPRSSFSIEVMTSLQENAFMNMPLNDVTNIYCWLAALGGDSTSTSSTGTNQQEQEQRMLNKDLDLSALSLYISTFTLDSKCVSCSSPGGPFISQILQDLDRFGLPFTFREPMVNLFEEIVWQYWHNFDIDQLLQQAPAYCPHSPTYAPDAPALNVVWPELTGLTSESTEAILALGMITLHSAMVVAAKNHILVDADEGNNGDASLQPELPSGVNVDDLIDWTNIASDYGEWADFAFQEARAYLAEPIKEDKRVGRSLKKMGRSGGVTVRANELLREYVLDDDGGLIIDLDDTEVELFGAMLQFDRVQVYGLDTISNLDTLRPSSSPLILENSFDLDSLDVFIYMSVKENDDSQYEPIVISYSIRDIAVQLDTALGLNLDKLGNVRLGSIFDIDNIIFCLFDGVDVLDLSKFTFTVGDIDNPVIDGYFSSETVGSLRWMIESIFDKYRADIIAAVPLFFDSTLRGILNTNSQSFIQTMRNSCPTPTPFGPTSFADLRDLLLSPIPAGLLGGKGTSPYGNLFQTIYDKMTEEIFQNGATNRPLLNDVLRVLTEKQSNKTGSVYFPGNVMDTFADIKIAGLEAILGLTVSDVSINNVDSLGDPLDLFRPTNGEPFVLNNTMSFGVDSKPVDLATKVTLIFNDGADVALRNELTLTLTVEDVVLFGSVLLKMAENALSTFPLRDIANYNCWLATLLSKPDAVADDDAETRGMEIIDHSYSIGNFSLNVSCFSCSSPDFDALLETLYIPENATELETLLTDSIDSLSSAEFVEVLVDEMVKDSARQCPHRPEYDPEADGLSWLTSPGEALGLFAMSATSEPSKYFTIANALMASLLFIIGITSWCCVRRRNKNWVKSLDREGSILLSQQELKDARMQEMLNASTSSMLKSRYIPLRVRWGVPFALIINLGLLLVGHLTVLSTVNIDATVAGEEININNFIEFTFFGSTWETYQNGGKEFAILLWIFTGIWPYIKLLLSLLLWVLPPQRLSVRRRGQILLWIDALVKLSIIDIFTVILFLAVLLVFIGGPDESYLGEGVLYSFKAIVVPRAGFYCLIIAQRMSRVSSRFFLEYHEQVIHGATKAHERNQIQNKDSDGSMVEYDQERDASPPLLITATPSTPLSTQSVGLREEAEEEKSIDEPPPVVIVADVDSEESSIPSRLGGNLLDSEESSTPFRRSDRAENDEDDATSASSASSKFRWGTIGVFFGIITILSVFIIGCIFAPSISLDASEFTGLTVESGMTYEEAVSQYGVFLVVSSILVKARFVLNSRADYIGLGLLLAAVAISLAMVFLIQSYLFIKRKLKERRERQAGIGPDYGHKGCGLPLYLRQYKWRYMEIYWVAIVIGIWQLGSVSSYAIHLYCDTMRQIYDVLAFAGLVEDSTAQCFLIQTSLPGNILILMLSLGTLIVIFIFQVKAQCKSNIANALRWIDDDDVPRLSLAWSKDKSKNSRYSHMLTASGTWSESSSEEYEPRTPSTRALSTPPLSPESDDDDLVRSSRASQQRRFLSPPGSPESRMESMEQLPAYGGEISAVSQPLQTQSSAVSFRLEQRQPPAPFQSGCRSVMSDNTSSIQEGESFHHQQQQGVRSSIVQEFPPAESNVLQAYCEEVPTSNSARVLAPSNVEVVNRTIYDDDYYF